MSTLPRMQNGELQAYAWPGGYPLYYLDRENSALCPQCANKSDADVEEVPQFKPVDCGVHYEGQPIVCDQCGAEIGIGVWHTGGKLMKRTDPYSGPFPRKRHSHRCKNCEETFGQYNAVACYKSQCTRPQLVETCAWCKPAAYLTTSRKDGV